MKKTVIFFLLFLLLLGIKYAEGFQIQVTLYFMNYINGIVPQLTQFPLTPIA